MTARCAPVLLLAALACGTTPPSATADPRVTAAEPGPVTLRVGDAVRVGGRDPLTVTFRRVAEDSRCAVDVQCVWAGDAEVELRIARAGREAGTTLHTTLEPQQVEYDGWVVRLVALAPAPRTDVPRDDRAYVVTLDVRAP